MEPWKISQKTTETVIKGKLVHNFFGEKSTLNKMITFHKTCMCFCMRGHTHTHTHQWLCRGFKIFPKFFYNQNDFLIKTDFLKAWRHYNKQTQLPICMTIKVFKKYISPYLKYFLITLKTQACNNKILKRNELNERICFPLKNKQTCPVKIMVLTILYTYVIAPIAAC